MSKGKIAGTPHSPKAKREAGKVERNSAKQQRKLLRAEARAAERAARRARVALSQT
jgi:hypothetical protein